MTPLILPNPSGQVQYKADIGNSYGGRGCYYVGQTEIENPTEDIKYFSQMLADAVAALEHETVTRIDGLAAAARASYFGMDDSTAPWESLDENYKGRWRAVVRLILDNAP